MPGPRYRGAIPVVDVSFELRGKKTALEDVDEVERQALEVAARRIADALGSVTCAEHGTTPSVLVRGDDVRHLEFRVIGCCSALVDRAMDQLRDPAPADWWQKDPIPKDW